MSNMRMALASVLAAAAGCSADVVIGNFGAAVGTGTAFGTNSTTIFKAAGFTMGSEAYTLDSVALTLNFANGGTGIFSIWTGVGTPQVRVVDLVGPPQTGSGDFVFTPVTPLVLEAGETYWVYVESVAAPTGGFLWDATSPSTIPTGIATFVNYIFNGNPSAFRNRFEVQGTLSTGGGCYANCDNSTTAPVLNVADFTCFLNRFAAGESYANCDESTTAPVLNVADFTCFLQSFAGGCP